MHELVVRNTGGAVERPALIAGAGKPASLRFAEFFTVNIRNKNTRTAYARAAAVFLGWCETRAGLAELRQVQPVHVAAYIEELQGQLAAPTVKQHLACLRMLFDWLVIGQIIPSNPAHSVRGPRHSVSEGSTRVISSAEATELLKGMNASSVVVLRDRTIIAVMTYTFARVGAVVALAVEDYYPQKKHWWLKLHEKNGKVNEMPCHPSWPSIWMNTSKRPASPATAKARCSARPCARRRRSPRCRCPATTCGTWCAAAPKTPALKPRSAAIPSAPPA